MIEHKPLTNTLDKFGGYVWNVRSVHGGTQYIFKFPNGYGASVICHEYSYGHQSGLWEVAMMYGDELCYDIPLKGGLNDNEVSKMLSRIIKQEKSDSETIYAEFVGGEFNKFFLPIEKMEILSNGKRSIDWSTDRERGGCVPRKELDNRPMFNGYLSPMWDGYRYKVNGKWRYEFEIDKAMREVGINPDIISEEDFKSSLVRIGVIRYITYEAYELLSH